MKARIYIFSAIVNAVIAAYFFQYATINETFALGAIPNTLASLGFLAAAWFKDNSNPGRQTSAARKDG